MNNEQNIELRAYCEKGIGQTHAKWSPVSTASYRLLPDIAILSEIKNKEAEALKKTCPMGVFDIEDLGKGGKVFIPIESHPTRKKSQSFKAIELYNVQRMH